MLQLVYVSAASYLMTESALLDLLTVSRRNNERVGLTGMLLYRDGCFLQLLEGDREPVKATYERILADPRHRDQRLMLETEADERLCSDWAMGFRNLSDPGIQSLPGFSPFMLQPTAIGTPNDKHQNVIQLLDVFRRLL